MGVTKFGRYELLERIGGGGMAEVYRARSSGVAGFEKIVAIKRILPALVNDPEFVGLFVEEAKISASLTHSNIAQVFEFGQIDDTYFIAMEYVNGKDLRSILRQFRSARKTMPMPLAVHVVLNILSALAYAHGRKDTSGQLIGIVHRDVSPPNVLISYEGAVKLIDFGIAKAQTRSSRLTGNLAGNIAYMSPEQAEAKGIDARSDLFAVGNLLYECVVGKPLFDGQTDLETLDHVRTVRFVPPSQANPWVPKPLEAIICKALQKNPDDRYRSAEEMQRALEQFVQSSRLAFSAKQLSRWMKATFRQRAQQAEPALENSSRPSPGNRQGDEARPAGGVSFQSAGMPGARAVRSTLRGFERPQFAKKGGKNSGWPAAETAAVVGDPFSGLGPQGALGHASQAEVDEEAATHVQDEPARGVESSRRSDGGARSSGGARRGGSAAVEADADRLRAGAARSERSAEPRAAGGTVSSPNGQGWNQAATRLEESAEQRDNSKVSQEPDIPTAIASPRGRDVNRSQPRSVARASVDRRSPRPRQESIVRGPRVEDGATGRDHAAADARSVDQSHEQASDGRPAPTPPPAKKKINEP